MILRDKCGWPVVKIKGRPVINFFRFVIITDIGVTWHLRKEGWPKQQPDPNAGCQTAPVVDPPKIGDDHTPPDSHEQEREIRELQSETPVEDAAYLESKRDELYRIAAEVIYQCYKVGDAHRLEMLRLQVERSLEELKKRDDSDHL